jgi:hypothetical protein
LDLAYVSNMTWSGNWADDCEEDLGAPPIAEPQADPKPRSYAAAITEVPPVETRPVIPRSTDSPFTQAVTRPRRKPRQEQAPQQFPRESWGAAKTHMRVSVSETTMPDRPAPRTVKVSASYSKVEFAVSRRSERPPQQETKCGKCQEKRGYLKFTERHVDNQTKDETNRLTVGIYCQDCVSKACPRCQTPECMNKTIICLPDARYPFGLFCSPCMSAYHARKAAS